MSNKNEEMLEYSRAKISAAMQTITQEIMNIVQLNLPEDPHSHIIDEKYYTQTDCAKLIKVSFPTICLMLKSGKIPYVVEGKKKKILGKTIKDYLKSKNLLS